MIELLTGVQHDCNTKTSAPRTFSSILTRISPSLNSETRASPRPTPKYRQISFASAGLALPENSLSSFDMAPLDGPKSGDPMAPTLKPPLLKTIVLEVLVALGKTRPVHRPGPPSG